jgi:hypothetical protein
VSGGGETDTENVRGAKSSCEGGTSQIFIRYIEGCIYRIGIMTWGNLVRRRLWGLRC